MRKDTRVKRVSDSGMTLIEILAVVAIIAILAGLLLPAIATVRSRARRALARTEIKNLETAWKKYYSEYGRWPSNLTENTAYAIIGDRADLLQGQDVDGQNRRNLVFSEFRRFDNDGNPINPWWNDMQASTDCYYYVKFDIDHDHVIAADTGQPPDEDVRRSVILWTQDPKADTGSTTRLIRSW